MAPTLDGLYRYCYRYPYRYLYCGCAIESTWRFPELGPPIPNHQSPMGLGTPCPKRSLRILEGPVNDEPLRQKGLWFAKTQLNQALLRVESVATFKIVGGDHIVVDSAPEADPSHIRAYLLGTAMAVAFYQQGVLPLHVSAVSIDGQAYAFTAPSGTGKSTLAARLYRSLDCPIVSDDVAVVDWQTQQTQAAPVHLMGGPSSLKVSEPVAQLFDNNQHALIEPTLNQEYRVWTDAMQLPKPWPLAGLVFLHRTPALERGGLRINRVLGTEALSVIKASVYRYPMGEALQSMEEMFRQIARLGQSVPCYIGQLGPWSPTDDEALDHALCEQLVRMYR